MRANHRPSAVLSQTIAWVKASARVKAVVTDRRGSVSIITALTLTVLLGCVGLGLEVGSWYLQQRDMQNAADSAAIAAATNGRANYDVEAKAVAAQYGFTDGSNGITVAVSNAAPCPS